jgi:MraZ protein
MFQGETVISVDEKGRLAIPTAYRELIARACDNHMVIAYNPFESGCLWLFPRPEWERVRDRVTDLSTIKRVHRDLQLKLVGAAAQVDLDGAARVLLPASQRAASGIGKKAVLLGMGNKFELWSDNAHLAKIQQTIAEEEISEEMAGLKL